MSFRSDCLKPLHQLTIQLSLIRYVAKDAIHSLVPFAEYEMCVALPLVTWRQLIRIYCNYFLMYSPDSYSAQRAC